MTQKSYRKYINSSCNFCGKDFTHRSDSKNRFCSRVCAGKSRRKKPKVCIICGQEYISTYHHNKTKHCSVKCASVSRKKSIKIPCFVCKETVIRTPSTRKKKTFCSRSCMTYWRKGLVREKSPRWKGGFTTLNGGYIFKIQEDGTYKEVHRINMEKHLGRKLSADEIVHHINEDKSDNRIENLQIVTREEHAIIHKPRLGTGSKKS